MNGWLVVLLLLLLLIFLKWSESDCAGVRFEWCGTASVSSVHLLSVGCDIFSVQMNGAELWDQISFYPAAAAAAGVHGPACSVDCGWLDGKI